MRGKVRDLLSTLTLSKAKSHSNTCNGLTGNNHVSNKGLQWRGSTGSRGAGNGSVLAAGSGDLCETDALTEVAVSGGDKLEGSDSVKDDAVHLKRRLGLFSGVALIVGTMIGSGIFVSPSGLLIRTGSVGMSFVIWIACGLLSLLGALAYAELGTMNTSSGAEYAYFMDAFGPMPAFLFSWASTLVLKPSQMAIICLSFAKYAVEAFVAECEPPDAAVKAVSVLVIVIILFINCYSVNLATGVQNVFTAAKLIAILIVILGGLYKLIQGNTQHLENVFHGSTFSFGSIAIAFYTGLWAYDGWNNLNYVTEEIKNPSRNLPMSIIIAIPLVTACYVLINISYLAVMSAAEMIESEAVAVTFGNRILGVMAWLIPLSVTVSTFGSANGTLFAAGRLCFAASREGHLMDILSYVHIRRFTPAPGLIFHSLIAIAMVLSGTIDSLIDFFSFTAWIFYGGAMLALIVMRYTKPDHPRPYKVPIIIPAVVLVISFYLIIAPIIDVPQIEYLYAAFFIVGGLVFYIPFVYYGVHCRIMDRFTVFCQLLLEVAPTQKMGAVYRSICTEADALLLIVTRLAEKEIKLKLDIERLMNEGFVNIAKARYIMGSTCVTKMQLPTKNSNPIKPLVTVCRKEIDNNWVFCISRKNCFKSSESINEVFKDCVENSGYDLKSTSNSKTSTISPDVSEAAFKNLMQNDPKSLKKSKNAFLVENDLYQSYNDELLDEMSNSDSHESLVSVTDPIRLFGILVPKALKEAQMVFNDVVDLLGECATVQLELKEALHKFNHLEKVKNLIIAASKEMKLDVLTPKVYWTPSESRSVSCYSVEEKGEEEEENEEKDKLSEVSIKKSIRSVFYDVEDVGPQEAELSDIWPSVISEHESDN